MRDRIIGIENEYAFLIANADAEGPESTAANQQNDTQSLTSALAHLGGRFGLYSKIEQGGRLWLPNGGCLYIDLGKLEWASPECKRVRDAVLYNKAGERVINHIERKQRRNGHEYHFFKTNVAPDRSTAGKNDDPTKQAYVSFGCHENYLVFDLVPPSTSAEPYMPLIPFLITRQVYGGSGWWPQGDPDLFLRSQRASFISRLASSGTTASDRAIINQRNESLAGLNKDDPVHRFHLILGDANMLEYALFLKVGATMLTISLLEEGLLPEWIIKPYARSSCTEDHLPVAAFKHIAEESDLSQKTLLLRRKDRTTWQCMSPLEVQTMYCEFAHRYCRTTSFSTEEAEDEALQICTMWDETLTALARDDGAFLNGRIDWYTKRRIAEAAAKQCPGESVTGLYEDIDLLYHDVQEHSMYRRLVEKGVAVQMLSADEIRQAVAQPPPPTLARGTRATVRGTATNRILNDKRLRTKMSALPDPSWLAIQFHTGGGGIHGFAMNDPFGYEISRLDALLEWISI